MEGNEERSLRSVFDEAEREREAIEKSVYHGSDAVAFQENLLSAIQLYETCLRLADRLALFSPNETLEDIGTTDLRYLLLQYHLAELVFRIDGRARGGGGGRAATLRRAQENYAGYLKRLDEYDMLSAGDASTFERWRASPASFSTASKSDAAARRATKIGRLKEEQALKQKLEHMRRKASVRKGGEEDANDDDDEGVARELHLTHIAYCTHQTFQSLESIALELDVLSLAPPSSVPDLSPIAPDARERGRGENGYSDRLDVPSSHLSAGRGGPLLDKAGKPLRPFTLTSQRREIQNGVFRPDHSLPTMSIDQYLEEERRRGGMIDGGGPQSQVRPVVDEDDMEAADRETIKAREWDEFVEANPKGSGNTLNRG